MAKKVEEIRIGEAIVLADSDGDTWDYAWAKDGNLYTPSNDTSGFGNQPRRNIAYHVVAGDDYRDLTGTTLNRMDEYGEHADKKADNRTWKSSGSIAVDDVLYVAVGRHCYGNESGDPDKRQTVVHASIIKSADQGQTWVRSAQENYEKSMFPKGFGTPFFIHYGQDGAFADKDRSRTYIYAISNNGFWDNGDYYVLGRVERAKIGELNAADWQFYAGGDGLEDGNWSADAAKAQPVIRSKRCCGETGATYIPAIDRYLLVGWYYTGNGRDNSDETWFTFYEAPHPWGPWEPIGEHKNNPEGWYVPRVLSKWQTPTAAGVDAVLATAGDYLNSRYYKAAFLPLSIVKA